MDKNTYTPLERAEIGTNLERPLLVTAINDVYKNGQLSYVKITFRDGFTENSANMFRTSAAKLSESGIEKYTVADVILAVSDYNGSRSFLVNQIVPTKTALTADDFTRVPPLDRDEMFDEIIALLDDCADDMGGKYTPLSKLAKNILTEYKDNYKTSSAAVSMHHNILSGLIYHSYRMVKAADAICTVYTSLDRELLLSAAAIHDIGKLWEYRTHRLGDAEFTPSGVLFGHIYMGASLIKGGSGDDKFCPEKIKLLRHMILSHHGTLEWGAVVPPAIPEAFALHYIDNLDAKLYVCETQYEIMDEGTVTLQKPFGLDGRLYKPKYED